MKYISNAVILVFWIILVTAMVIPASCDYPANGDSKLSVDPVIDTTILARQVDTGYRLAWTYDSVSSRKILSNFNNPALARQFPSLVFKAYLFTMFSGKWDYEDIDTTDNSFTSNVYNEFNRLVRDAKSDHFQTYQDHLKARILNNIGKNELALPLFLSLLPRFEKYNDSYGLTVALKRTGIVYLDGYRNYEKAAEYFTRAALQTTVVEELERIYLGIIPCYFNLHKFDSLTKYVNLFKKLPSFGTGYFYNFTNAHYQIYLYAQTDSGHVDSVYKYLIPDLKLHVDVPHTHYYKGFMVYFSAFCEALLKHKEFEKLDSLIQVVDQFEKNNPTFEYLSNEFYHVCYRYYELKQDIPKALSYLKKYNQASIKINFEEKRNKVETARIEFEAERKNQNLLQEQERTAALAEQEIQKQKILRNSFIGLLILLLILIIVLINRAKLKRTIEMERMRSRLSRDLHDDIGSTLSSINILSRTAQLDVTTSNTDKTKVALGKINERSQRLLDNIGDIIWNINPGNDSIEEVMSRMREYATGVLESKNINYTFNFPKETMECTLSMEIKYNLYLIFKEAVNNLAKYSACTQANLSLTFDEKNLFLRIEDNGSGFDQNSLHHRGGLSNMQYRAKEINGSIQINSTPGKGTVIALSMPRFC